MVSPARTTYVSPVTGGILITSFACNTVSLVKSFAQMTELTLILNLEAILPRESHS
jgi:hypothetical protein